tara:strand:+ start:587 stop:793 length:207 start_codon:yes stop_codon:yes gene_type:complete
VDHLISIGVGVAGPALLGIFAFAWKVNSRLSAIERDLKNHEQRIKSAQNQLNQHFDKAFTIRKSISDD